MPLVVRLRPNAAYLALLALFALAAILGVAIGGAVGYVLLALGVALVVMVGYPVVASTVLRVPVLALDGDGIRLPLMGVRLAWSAVSAVRPSVDSRGQPLLLIVPVDPAALVRQARPWLRAELRTNLARYGTPVAVNGRSLDHSLDEIATAARNHI
jgi:hypothetical protein